MSEPTDLSGELSLLKLRGETPNQAAFLRLLRGEARADPSSLPLPWAALLAHLETPARQQAFAVAFITRQVRPPDPASSLHPLCLSAAACVTGALQTEAANVNAPTPVLDALAQADEFTLEDLRLSSAHLRLPPALTYWTGWLLNATRVDTEKVLAQTPESARDHHLTAGMMSLYDRLLERAPTHAPPRMAGGSLEQK